MSKEKIQKAADNFHREDAALALTREALRLEQAAERDAVEAWHNVRAAERALAAAFQAADAPAVAAPAIPENAQWGVPAS